MTPKALTDQTVEDHDQALGIHDGLTDALRGVAEALGRCCRESSFGTLKFVARILEALYRRLLASHSLPAWSGTSNLPGQLRFSRRIQP